MSDKEIIHDATIEESFDNRQRGEEIRDVSGKITGYKFTICVRDEKPFEGHLSRDEMNTIYKLYSSEGSGLQQRTISREFGDIYTFGQFKKILRAFNITKASAPFAPHIIEERSVEDLIKLNFQSKENDILKKLDQGRSKEYENKYKELVKEHYDLKHKLTDLKEFFSEVEFKIIPVNFIPLVPKNNNTIIIYLSDMHIGAEVSNYSIYENNFNLAVAEERITAITFKIFEICELMNITNIIICNVGDSLDGYNGQTTRGGHTLPQNMNNKDQYKNFNNLMISLFENLVSSGYFSSIKYRCSDGGNHDGDIGFIANSSLEACLGRLCPEVDVEIFDKFMDYFTVGNNSFIHCHGKDAKDMFRGLPLTINDKVENQITEFVQYNNIPGTIHFIKGDLHQTATTYGKRVRYKSVGSFFGSSQWIHLNFGNTLACVDYDIIINNTDIFEGRLILNKKE